MINNGPYQNAGEFLNQHKNFYLFYNYKLSTCNK